MNTKKIKAQARSLRKFSKAEISNAEAYGGMTKLTLIAGARRLEEIADTHELLGPALEILRDLYNQERVPHKARKLPHKTWLEIGKLLSRLP